jgi:NADPH:quinone reductase
MQMTNKMKQVQINQYGSPDVLKLVETDIPQPKAGEVVIKVAAIGVNYSDTLRRRNQYFQPTPLPCILGSEAVGKIVEVGEGVETPFKVGTTVLAILPFGGGYAEYVAAIAQYCVPLPPNIDTKTATAIFVQGSTAQLMISQIAPDLQGKTVLINAAAGGVGSLLVQLAKLNGANVIGASSSAEKLEVVKENGADSTVNYSNLNWSEKVKEANAGKGVDIIFDAVGGDVYNESLKCLAQGGQIIVYGCASGVQGNVHPEHFVDENISQSGFNLAFYITTKMQVWQEALGTVIGLIAQGKLKIEAPKTFDLKDAAEAHRQIEARQTTGKVVLTTK